MPGRTGGIRSSLVTSGRFQCRYCQLFFKHEFSRDRHVRSHIDDKRFQCIQCDSAFSRSDHLKIHMKTHNLLKPFQCYSCNQGYDSVAGLSAHMRVHKRNKSSSSMEMVNGLFGSLVSSAAAVSAQQEQKQQQQQNLYAAFVSKLPHYDSLYDSQDYANPPSASTSRSSVKKSPSQKQQCPYCTKPRLFLMDELEEHIAEHLTKQNTVYRCEHCVEIRFDTRYKLDQHLTDKHSITFHQCLICQENFSTQTMMEKHIKSSHSSELVNYGCAVCPKLSFPDLQELRKHFQTQHCLLQSSLQ